ncbi:MAG: FHA domain-containing protein [Anaerolineae bacterium]
MAYDDQATAMGTGRPSARLIVRQGTQAGITFPLNKDQIVVGREEGVDIVVQDPEVSRRHLQINWQADAFVVRDLGSTNGVFVNGVEITAPHSLQNGDSIRLGQTIILFQISDATLPHTSPVSSGQPAPVTTGPAAQELTPRGSDTRRWLLIGCGCLAALCACLVLALGVAVATETIDLDSLIQAAKTTSLAHL